MVLWLMRWSWLFLISYLIFEATNYNVWSNSNKSLCKSSCFRNEWKKPIDYSVMYSFWLIKFHVSSNFSIWLYHIVLISILYILPEGSWRNVLATSPHLLRNGPTLWPVFVAAFAIIDVSRLKSLFSVQANGWLDAGVSKSATSHVWICFKVLQVLTPVTTCHNRFWFR